jgi:rod shape determining protein RodA
MFIDRRYFRFFDWFGFAITIILVCVGLLFVYSATYSEAHRFSSFFKKQIVGAVSGFILYFIFSFISPHKLQRYGFFAFGATILLLIYTYIAGWIGMGAKRWLSLYFFRFQPSELIRLFLPAFIATYGMEQRANKTISFNAALIPLCCLGFVFVLVLKQPDLGTALILFFSGLITLWIAGLDKKVFAIGIIIATCGAPFFWKVLKPYQKQRIMVALGYGETHKERYHIEQSKIAIGSGGLSGKGFLKGTQNKFEFLPEDHTDFIFSVICEEWGFVGALFILLLFAALFARIIFIILSLTDITQQIIAVGLLIHIMLSVCINSAMVTGLLPIVGIPLPLISYGLSNLWVTLASLGWLNNIAVHRYNR